MVEPLLYQFPSSFFQFTSSLLPFSSSLLPIHFQSTSSLLPVFIQTPPTSKSTFLCQFFSLYELWANSDSFGQYILFWLICLKPYSLKDRYPMYTIEKTKKNNLTNWNKESTSSLLPVFIHLLGVYLCVKFLIFYKLLQIDTVWTNNDIDNPLCNVEKKDQTNWRKECDLPKNLFER